MLESRSTRKGSPAAPPHLEAASDLARRRTRGVRDAEDVVHYAYLRAVRSFDGFHGDNARGWVRAIRRNAWFTGWQRRRQMADGAPCDDALHGEQRLHGWPGDTGSDPQNFSVRRNGIHLPRQTPGAQSVEHRDFVVLLDLEGMSDRENATVIDVPVGPIISGLSRDRALVFVAVRVVQAASPHRPGEEASDRSVVSGRAYPALQSAPSESVRGENESSFSLAALGNQIRRLRIASTAGPCAFSATAIRKGDSVFKPNRRPRPFNTGDMIPQSEVPEHISIYRGPLMPIQTSIT